MVKLRYKFLLKIIFLIVWVRNFIFYRMVVMFCFRIEYIWMKVFIFVYYFLRERYLRGICRDDNYLDSEKDKIRILLFEGIWDI